MDYTETPHAEDFAEDISYILDKYLECGLKVKVAKEILTDIINDLEEK